MKDPIAYRIYLALAASETATPGLAAWLEKHGHDKLATCPTCGRRKFRHARGCVMGDAIEMLGTLRPDQVSLLARGPGQGQRKHRPRSRQ